MSARGRIDGIEVVAPLAPEEERRLYPLITRGREAAARLASGRVKDPAERRRWARQRHDGQAAESLLLRATLGLVRARVVERGYRFGNEELEAAGLEGLVNALSRFDPEKGARFATYANYWIAKLVNQAIQQQAGLTDTEMRAVLALQKLERSAAPRVPTLAEVAAALGVSASRAKEVVQMSRDLQSRRFESAPFEDAAERRPPPEAAPAWVIDELKRLCGDDFDAFWQYTFHSSSMSELAAERSISRQAMSKRLERCRRAVRESPSAERLQAWLDSQ
jgi:RNA polymerase sigma factor (sigma-70 family)